MGRFFTRQSEIPLRSNRSTALQERASDADLQARYAFRRNRTITGSSSSDVKSPNELNADLKSPRVQAHILGRQRRRLGALFVASVACAAALGWLTSQFTATAILQAAPDPTLQLSNVYAKTIKTYLSQQPLERFRFFTDIGELTRYIQAVSPEVKEVRAVDPAGFGASRFTVVLRQPIASWSINGRPQFVDETGTPFERNYYDTPPLEVIDRSGIQVEAGRAVASNRFLGFVGKVVARTRQQGLTVTHITIPAGTTRQIELRLKDIAYPVKLSIDRPAGEQVEDMSRVLSWMKGRKLSPQYIDVRVSGRAYYR